MSKTHPSTPRERFAWWLMNKCYRLVERIDRKAVPKVCSLWTFTFERNSGVYLHQSPSINNTVVANGYGQPGCPLVYLNDWDYEKAHTESINGS